MSGLTIQSPPIDPRAQDPFLHHICSELTYEELATKVSRVCRTWKEWADSFFTAKELGQLNVRIFSHYAIKEELKGALPPEMFAQLSFDKIPHTIDFRMALIKASRFFAQIQAAGTAVEADEGLFIVPRPEGLTLNMLHTAYRTRFKFIWEPILEELGDKKSEGGQYILTCNILEKARSKTVDEQQSLSKEAGGDLPEILNAVFYALMVEKFTENIGSYTRSGLNPFDTEHPFSRGQCTYVIRPFSGDRSSAHTRCLERITWPLAVGGFAQAGLEAYCSFNDIYRGNFGGGAALRKF